MPGIDEVNEIDVSLCISEVYAVEISDVEFFRRSTCCILSVRSYFGASVMCAREKMIKISFSQLIFWVHFHTFFKL